MSKFRFAPLGLLLAAIGLTILPAAVGLAPAAIAADQALRPEIGKPLQAAQELAKAHKFKDALAKVKETDAVGGKTPNEIFMIERMRGSIAASMGDNATAAKAFEAVVDSGKLPQGEELKHILAVGSLYYQAKDYPKAITWINRYFKEGGNDSKMRQVLVQSYYLSGDYANAGKQLLSDIQAEEKNGQAPSEEELQLLANCALKQNDKGGYVNAIEKLVAYHPKKEYWSDLITRVVTKPGFSDRLTLDVYRLKLAINQMKPAEYMEMAQLSLQAGLPAEAVKVIDQGYKSGALGTGAEADRQKRLRDLANKTLADDQKSMAQNQAEADKSKDGIGLVNLGFEYVMMGQADKGLPLMDQGIKKGGLKRPEDAKLHYGIALLMAGKKSEAAQVLKTVQGNDGTADLARYWILQSKGQAS